MTPRNALSARVARLLALLALGTTLATAAHGGRKLDEPPIVDDALAYANADRHKALTLLESALAGAPAEERDILLLHIGEQKRLLGDLAGAEGTWQPVLDEAARGPLAAACRLGLALVGAQRELDDKSARALLDIDDRDGLDSQNADRFLLLAMHARSKNDTSRYRDFAKRARAFAKREPSVVSRIDQALAALDQGEAVDMGPRGGNTRLDRAEAALQAGNREKALRLAEEVIAEAPDTEDAYIAAYIEKRAEAVPVKPGTIGLLLPQRGRYAAVGDQIEAAFQLGYRRAGGRARFEIADAGETAEDAIRALETLVLQKGAIAVVGPLRSDIADEVVRAANALRVPIIGLHQAVGTTDERPWAFQGMINPAQQADALAAYVSEARDMKAFAIFAPDTPYGHTSAEAFQAAVEARGGSIKVTTFYDNEATSVIPFAKELGRKDYEARSWEFKKLKDEAEEKGGNPDRVVLPPVIDYDAIFVPDNARRIPIACAGLAYEEFPVGDFQTTRGGDTIPLLGLSGWNRQTVVQNGGPYVRGAIFTDIYLPDSRESAEFARAFREETGRTPSVLEVAAHDTGALVAQASAARATDRDGFRQALQASTAQALPTGVTGFDPETRLAIRQVKLLSLDKDRIFALPWPAPDEPEEGEAPPE